MDEEKPHAVADGNGMALSEKSVAMMNEGVGDCMAYRRRKGRFTVVEWLVSIILPILVILLGKPGGVAAISHHKRAVDQYFQCMGI